MKAIIKYPGSKLSRQMRLEEVIQDESWVDRSG